MKRFGLVAALAGLLLSTPLLAQQNISHGRFKDVQLYTPKAETKSFVLFLSGERGWDTKTSGMAQALVDQGAMVAGISTPQLFAALEHDGDDCVFPDGDLENLSHYLRGYAKLPTYYPPILVGYSAGAALAYAMIAQAPAHTFAAAISLGFCPSLSLRKPLCTGEDLHFTARKNDNGVELQATKNLRVPWLVLQGETDQVCSAKTTQTFMQAMPASALVIMPKVDHDFAAPTNWMPQYVAVFRSLASSRIAAAPPPASLSALPLIEVPATGNGDTFAVLLSGDGGWAGLDKEVADALAAKGIPVVGLDSLRYFWTARTPQGLATDLDHVLRYYATHWKKSRVLLIGYSQGADVLPFAVNRLPAASKKLVAQTVLMALGRKASFEFHLGNWVASNDDGLPIQPEVDKLSSSSTLCLYGEDEAEDSLCPRISAAHVRAVALTGGHHFDGAYDKLVELMLARSNSQ